MTPSRVVFIAPTVMQVAEVRHAHADRVNAIRWQDVCAFLQGSGADGVRELVEFLALQGLGATTPLTWPKLAAYVTSRSVEKDCLRLVQLLEQRVAAGLAAGDWSFLPKRFQAAHAYEKLRWGRVGVELHDGHWPCLFLGFLLDGTDHALTLVSPSTSIDLMLSLDADPKLVIDPVCAQRADTLRATAVDVLHGAALKNKWRKLVVREPLIETIRAKPSDEDQVEAIYARLRGWCAALFPGGELGLRSS
jgi:hypothetical protein